MKSIQHVDGNLMRTARPLSECASPFEALRPIEVGDRERAELRRMPVREFLAWRDELRADYREMLLWPRFTLLMNIPLRGWMVPGSDATTAAAWGGRRARPVV